MARVKRFSKGLTVESELSGEDACERPAVVSLVGHQLDLSMLNLDSGIQKLLAKFPVCPQPLFENALGFCCRLFLPKVCHNPSHVSACFRLVCGKNRRNAQRRVHTLLSLTPIQMVPPRVLSGSIEIRPWSHCPTTPSMPRCFLAMRMMPICVAVLHPAATRNSTRM